MSRPISRREVLGNLLCASTAALLIPARKSETKPILIGGRPVEIIIASESSHTVRISVLPIGEASEQIQYDGSLVRKALARPRARLKTLAPVETVQLDNVLLKIDRDPLTIRVEDKGRQVQRLRIDQMSGGLSFSIGAGPVFGLGEGGPQFDRRGHVDQMRSGQGGYRLRTHGGRAPVPWLIGTSGWAMYIHQPFGTFDLTGAEGRFNPVSPAAALPLDVFIVGARDPTQVMKEYARLTGYPEMPPLWSFGYLQSHRALTGPDEIKWVARTFREKRLPCDALIYLGTGFTPSGWNTYNGEFAWHPGNFPDPRKTIEELHANHFKVVLHIVLEGQKLTGTVNDPCTTAPLPSGRMPDNSWPPNRQVSCYWPVHKQVYDAGIDGWWVGINIREATVATLQLTLPFPSPQSSETSLTS